MFTATALVASGQPLKWDTTAVKIDAPPLAETVEAAFTFTNTSTQAVTIAEVHSSCGCTVPVLEKRIYEPGESGTIRATFTIGERTGPQEKNIVVTTAAPQASQTVLGLQVQIPKLFEAGSYFVIWNRGESPAAKTIELRILNPDLLTFDRIESRHANFTATVAPAADKPGAHVISIAPVTTEAEGNGAIVATLRGPGGESRAVTLYALVRSASVTPTQASAQPAAR